MKPSYADCRRASRSVRRAGNWPTARTVIRPRGQSWLFRSRPPLAVLLHRAAVEGRLVWRSPDELILLDPPTASRRAYWLDRFWDYLLFFVPVMVSWGVALAARPWLPLTVALSLVLAGVAWIALLMTAGVTAEFVSVGRSLMHSRSSDEDDSRFARLAKNQWSIGLCHISEPARVATAITDAVSVADTDVLCRTEVITTADAAEMVAAGPGVRRLTPDSNVLVLPRGPRPRLTIPSGRAHLGSMLLWPLAAIVVVVAVGAQQVAAAERAGCIGGNCPDRPTTYWEAVYWLLNRLSGGDPNGLGAVTFQGRTLGLLTTLASAVLIGILINFVIGQIAAQARDVGREAADAFNAATPTDAIEAPPVAAGVSTYAPAIAIFAIGVLTGATVLRVLRRRR